MQRLRVTSMLAKIESVYAQDPIPTGLANAILLKGEPSLTPMELTEVQRDVLRAYFGNAEILPSSIFGKLELEVEAAGSGTAGVAPAWGVLARACSMSETVLATDLSGTAQAGGTTTTIKLAAGASAVNDFYNGMPISISAGTGSGKSGVVVDYDGATKVAKVASNSWVAPDNTSQYTIGASAVYKRITNNPESVTLYFNIDGVLHKFTGARGDLQFMAEMDKVPSLKMTFQGLFTPVTEAITPTLTLTSWKQPRPFNKANTPFATLHGYPIALEKFDLGLGNQIAFHTLVNSAQDQMLITDSQPKGTISFESPSLASKDFWAAAQNVVLDTFAVSHGTVAGNRVAVAAASVQLAKPNYGKRNGIAMINAALVPMPISGDDDFTITAY